MLRVDATTEYGAPPNSEYFRSTDDPIEATGAARRGKASRKTGFLIFSNFGLH
jgi:hypothetical protein